ncbi:MAG TPA: ABC transporter ATP-binding protein [Candidatus Sulfomarinibacteraceae bacterium]|nr:ABC transporter ATP-binding protein [Candidatus Sulfomarinibacteraceae bacterium]
MSARPLLEAAGLRRSYPARGLAGRGERVAAVDGVDLEVGIGEAVAVVGASGAGKSTLARLLLALERPDAGVVRFDGHEISALPESAIRPLRRRFQPVFQDPLAALDPRMRIAAAVAEPLAANGIGTADERRRRVAELLEQVGLGPELGRRRPAALSGGERQRACIARALASKPELLVLDEPLASLDATVQVRVADLLVDLRRRLGLALLVVSHDLALVRGLCDRVLVMAAGRVVEEGDVATVLDRPSHPVTRELLAAERPLAFPPA